MKSRTSFFDKTALKKDLLRFAPVWVMYIIIGLLVQSLSMGSYYFYISRNLSTSIGTVMCLINCGYGILVALLLFGDLFNSRMCNALHAMPLKRETWFATHILAGLLFFLIPNGVMTIIYIGMTKSLWFTALLWLGGSLLSYLFFFGVAVLAVMATGNRFAALTVYGLINFVSMELLWIIDSLILPHLNGVVMNSDFLMGLSPTVFLASKAGSYFTLAHNCDPSCTYWTHGGTSRSCVYVFDHFGGSWWYLFVIALVGILFGLLALWLYRRRQLECAGDFAAIRPTRWAVTIFGTMGCGMVFRLFGFEGEVLEYLFLYFGMAVGFFLLQMLLQRKTRVFGKKNWQKLLVLVLCFTLVLALGIADVLGIQKRIPKADRVEKVLLSDHHLSEYDLNRINNGASYLDQILFLQDRQDIDLVRRAHQQMLDLPADDSSYSSYITLCYYLKDGSTVIRRYRIDTRSEAYGLLAPYFKGYYLFGVSTPEEIIKNLEQVRFDSHTLSLPEAEDLVYRLWADANAGLLIQNSQSHPNQASTWLDIAWDAPDGTIWRNIQVWEDARLTWSLLKSMAEQYHIQDWWFEN